MKGIIKQLVNCIRNNNLKLLSILLFVTSLYSCKRDIVNIEYSSDIVNNVNVPRVSSPKNLWKDNLYKLNVIYFVPNDVDTINNYRKRLSDVMLYFQNFYAENMMREGYGYRSFGLELLANNNVNITTITGNKGKAYYSSTGRIADEVFEYLNLYPSEKKSYHHLIITPTHDPSLNNEFPPAGQPAAAGRRGNDRYAVALDYPEMSIEKIGKKEPEATNVSKFIGTIGHELGHCLNIWYHDKEHKHAKLTLGNSLMSEGGLDFGLESAYLTSGAITLLSNGQLFANYTRTDWYDYVSHKLIKLKAEYRNNNIIITGKYSSDLPVRAIVVYHDPHPAGLNNDYDAISWKAHFVDDEFFVLCPINEFHKLSGKYDLRICVMHENGQDIVSEGFEYEFENNIPNLDSINFENINPILLDKSQWTVSSPSKTEGGCSVNNIIDGNLNTIWHTAWKNEVAELPHEFIIDMGSVTEINGFAFTNRAELSGAMKNIEVFMSTDNRNWLSLGQYNLIRNQETQYKSLDHPQSMRYIKVSINTTYWEKHFTHLAEFDAY